MKKNLTILLMLAIAGAFSFIWAHEDGKGNVKVKMLAKSQKSWDGATLPEYPKGQPEITILKITIPPKTTLPMHKHPVINAGVLLKGELTVITESKKELHLKAGKAIIEVVESWHFGRNDGDTPAEIIVFYAGTKGQKITVKKE